MLKLRNGIKCDFVYISTTKSEFIWSLRILRAPRFPMELMQDSKLAFALRIDYEYATADISALISILRTAPSSYFL